MLPTELRKICFVIWKENDKAVLNLFLEWLTLLKIYN